MTDVNARIIKFRANRRQLLAGMAMAAPALALHRHPSLVGAQDKPELTVWFDSTNGAETADCVIEHVIDPYNESGTATIKPTLQANNWDATRTALSGGEGPDLVGTPGPTFAYELAKAGLLLELDGYAASEKWSENIAPWALSLGVVDGKLYSLPTEVETLVLYYNQTLFEEKGWTVPKTMDELMTLCQTISDDGIVPFAHANQEWRSANEWFVGEFLNQGAGPQKVYEVLTGAAKFTDPEFVEAITALDTIQQNGWFMGSLERYYTTTFDDANAAFADRTAAMKIEGTWWMQDADAYWGEDSGITDEWNWAAVPSKDGTPKFTLGIGSTNSINAKTEHPDEAAQYITNLYAPETQATLLVECNLVPGPVTIPEDLLTSIDERQAAILTGLAEASAANNYGYTTWTFFPPKTATYLIEAIEKVWAGDITVEEYLAGMQAQLDEELAAGSLPPIPAR